MHVGRVNTLMNGAQYADLKLMDSLERLSSIIGDITEGLPEHPGFYPGGLTIILTNPPFGSTVTNTRVLEDFAVRGGVTKRNGTIVKSLSQDAAFLNRCLEFLAPGGKLAIVVPDGMLANISAQFVRDWFLRWCKLKSVISLPQPTFAPYGAGVKTSIVVLEKRDKPLAVPKENKISKKSGSNHRKSDIQMELPMSSLVEKGTELALATVVDDTCITAEEDYDVYMARIDNIGYDSTGRLNVSEDIAPFPPEVAETITDFIEMVGW